MDQVNGNQEQRTEYTVDEILSQFWDEYTGEEEYSEPMEEPVFQEESGTGEDMDSLTEAEFPEVPVITSNYPDGRSESAEEDEDPKTDEENDVVTAADRKRKASLFSADWLRNRFDAVSDAVKKAARSKKREQEKEEFRPGWEPEHESAVLEDGTAEEENVQVANILQDFYNSASETRPVEELVPPLEPEKEEVSPAKEEEESGPVKEPESSVSTQDSQQADSEPDRRYRESRRRRKVQEEFPESPKQRDEPFVDNMDYSAIFRMFADQPENPAASASSAAGEEPVDDIAADAVSVQKEETPLLADNSMDFRDILREYMMADQHPLYAEMPGIGIKAQAEQETPKEKENADHPDRKTAEEEDFAIDLSAFMEGTDNIKVPGSGAADELPETEATEESEPEAREETDSDEVPAVTERETGFGFLRKREKKQTDMAGSSLRRMLRGIGGGTKEKQGLNSPKAYVSHEDYLPTEEEAEAAEQAAREAEAAAVAEAAENAALAEDEVPKSSEFVPVTSEAAENVAEDEDEILYEGDFPSFGQWILNELMSFWVRLNGVGDRMSTATMEEDTEDLGNEVNVANASRYYGSQVTMLRMRFQLSLALLAVLAWITLGLPVTGMLKTARVASAMCLGLQLTIMLLCLDVITNAAVNLTRGKFGADALAAFYCVLTCLDALNVAVDGFGQPHIPLCFFSSIALVGVLASDLLSSRALRKSMRVPAIARRAYCVTAEEGIRSRADITLLKSLRPTNGFVRRAEEAPPDETLFRKSALLELLAALVLSLMAGLIKHGLKDYLFIVSAILTCSVPVTALLSFALPYFIGSQRIFPSGAAIAGWSGIHDIGSSRNLIVTDRDLFPEDTVSIDTVRIFADESAERIIAFAGTMIAASGSGLGPCFADLMEKNHCRMRRVEEFQWLSGGGLQGLIEGHRVLCGNADLMQLMNVKIPYRLVDRATVLLAIDGVLYGIFKINYTPLPEVKTALQGLIASNRHPIFAIRDFNITPELLHEVFDVATDGYDFPPYGDRFRISEAQPSESSKVSAVVCREGLGPLTHLADTGRSMYVAVRMNLIITAAVAVLGILLVFMRLLIIGTVSYWLPFVLLVLDLLLVGLISLFMRF